MLGTWTGANLASAVVIAAGKVFVTGETSPGKLYALDPAQSPGALLPVATLDSNQPSGIAFDGTSLWTANFDGTLSVINAQSHAVLTFSDPELLVEPLGIVYDGAHISG